MADKNEEQSSTPQGADWEVVSLTASAYAAAPGGNITEFKHGDKVVVTDKDTVETSNTLFMSGHFVLPPGQHENPPSGPENTEILDYHVEKDNSSENVIDLGEKTDTKEEENWNLMKLTNTDFTENTKLSGKEQSIYGSPTLHSLQSEATIGALNLNDEMIVLDESIQSFDPYLGSNKHEGSGMPYGAWWKKQAASFYAHAKETNTFWSIFVAATAVMGIVIIGQQWQQERCQVLRHEWKSRIHEEVPYHDSKTQS